jgi:plasmid stabilization system protein ParE
LSWLPKAIAKRDAQITYIAHHNPLAAVTQGDRIAEQIDRVHW